MTPTLLILKSDTQITVRRQTFEVKNMDGIVAVVERLLSQRHTGPVVIELNQGGIRGIHAEHKINVPSS